MLDLKLLFNIKYTILVDFAKVNCQNRVTYGIYHGKSWLCNVRVKLKKGSPKELWDFSYSAMERVKVQVGVVMHPLNLDCSLRKKMASLFVEVIAFKIMPKLTKMYTHICLIILFACFFFARDFTFILLQGKWLGI